MQSAVGRRVRHLVPRPSATARWPGSAGTCQLTCRDDGDPPVSAARSGRRTACRLQDSLPADRADRNAWPRKDCARTAVERWRRPCPCLSRQRITGSTGSCWRFSWLHPFSRAAVQRRCITCMATRNQCIGSRRKRSIQCMGCRLMIHARRTRPGALPACWCAGFTCAQSSLPRWFRLASQAACTKWTAQLLASLGLSPFGQSLLLAGKSGRPRWVKYSATSIASWSVRVLG